MYKSKSSEYLNVCAYVLSRTGIGIFIGQKTYVGISMLNAPTRRTETLIYALRAENSAPFRHEYVHTRATFYSCRILFRH